jgi:WD40 repeat protein/DNA-binding SARP family transcriptional activator
LLLGPLSVERDDGGVAVSLGPRDRVVLAVLASRPREAVSVERLADALWGDDPPRSCKQVVAGCVMRLRRGLGMDAIETTPHGYRLSVRAEEIDAQRFEQLVGRGRELLTLGEPERAAFVVREALDLWRGQPLLELGEWEPGRIEAGRLDELRLDAEEVWIDACLQSGRHRDVLAEAQARVAEAPLRERRWALLARARYLAGRQGEALRTMRQARSVLASELGVDPGPELVDLEQAILRQDPALMTEALTVAPSAVCPYRGLVAFDVADAEGFFGRDGEIGECLRLLAATNTLALVGASGSGKSSLVRAGVADALRRDGRRVVVVTPTAHPMDALLLVPSHEAVLVVDQCEEVLTQCEDPVERRGFFDALAERADRGPVVVTVRADRLAELSAYPSFVGMVEDGLYLLGAMGEDDLRAAIEGPAHQAGLLLEPGLVDLLIGEVEGEPGALPLLSHALRVTWERREGRTLTVDGYRASGGIRGAVAQTAEEVYERLPPEQRPLLRDLLLRLVTPGPDTDVTRCRVPRQSVAIDAVHDQLVEQLIEARLVTSDDGVVELAHEALARAWPRLRGWLDDDVEGQRIFRHLTAHAEAWDRMGRPDSELYRGVRLRQALEWRDRARPTLSEAEVAYLDAGEALAEAEQRAAEVQARRQVRVNRRLRALLVSVGVLLAAAVVAGLLAWRQARRADDAARVADAGRLVALATNTEKVDRSLLLAVEAVRRDTSNATISSLFSALSRNPAGLIALARTDDPVVALDVDTDGRVAAAGSTTTLRDGGSLAPLHTSRGEAIRRLAFRPDGDQLAVVTDSSEALRLIDPTTLEDAPVQLGGLPSAPYRAWDLDYSADGRFLAVNFPADGSSPVHAEALVMVWDLAAPERPILRLDTGWSVAVALSPDGRRLYVHGDAGAQTVVQTVTAYDVATGRRVRRLPLTATLTDNVVESDILELSPDGEMLVVAEPGELVLLDADALTVQQRLPYERGAGQTINGRVAALEFSHDGRLLAWPTPDGTLVVWDLTARSALVELPGPAGDVQDLAFSPDDATLYVGASDGLTAWDVGGNQGIVRRLQRPDTGTPFADLAVPSPNGEAVVSLHSSDPSSRGDTIRFRDLSTGRLSDPITSGHDNWAPAWRPPRWEQFATADGDGVVRVWDWRSGQLVTEPKVANGYIGGIAYRGDGRRLVIGERSGRVFEVDADTFQPVGAQVELDDPVREVFTGPDPDLVVVLLSGGSYATVDLTAGRVVERIDLGVDPTWLAVSPDGARVAVGTSDGRVGLADVESGAWIQPPSEGHKGWVRRVSFAADGSVFASSGDDGQVRLWDGRTGTPVIAVTPDRPGVWTTVEFQPDGTTVIIADRDGAVYTWDTRPEQWIERACAMAGRNLTEAEWQDTFGDRPYRETCPAG